MSRQPQAAKYQSPVARPLLPGSMLPSHYTPKVAGYASGPFIEPKTVTPSHWRWRNARTYVVTSLDGHDYRCVRVVSGGEPVGYWAVELLGIPLIDLT